MQVSMESNARLIRPLIGVLLTAVTACSRGPYCYEWQKAYSRGDAAQTTAAHQQWLLAHLPEDILKLVKDEKGIIDRTRLAELEHLVLVNCDLHATLPVTTVLDDIAASYRAGNFKLFKE